MITKEIEGFKFNVRDGVWDTNIVYGELNKNPYDIPNGKVMIDIGAHIGGTTIKAASLGLNVFAYEPEETNFKLLKENVELNGFKDQVKCFKLGVGTEGELHLNDKNSGCFGSYRSDENVVKIKLTTLLDIFKKNKIEYCDILKLDCEGAEYDILNYEILDQLHDKIGQISVELHFATQGYQTFQLIDKYGPNYVQNFKDMLGKYYKIKEKSSDASSTIFLIAKK